MREFAEQYIRNALGITDVATIELLLGSFMNTLNALIADMERCLSTGDCAGICYAAHSLKGCAANVGAESLREIAARLQVAARDGDWRACQVLFDELLLRREAFVA